MTEQQPEQPGQPVTLPQLQLTTGWWRNRKRYARDIRGERTERWSKVLAHAGKYEQFRYGCNHPASTQASRGDGPDQRAIICCPGSGTIAVNVDVEELFMTTRTGQLIGREQALTTRGFGFHVFIDARTVPPEHWPKQGPIAGGDIKSNGFIPFPGCWHYSGDQYELADHGGGVRGMIVPATPELIAAINADRADHDRQRRAAGGSSSSNGHGGGDGGGHDGELAGAVLSMILRGLDKEQCYTEWLKIAVPRDPDWAYERHDFERHYGDETRGALAKARKQQEYGRLICQAVTAWLGNRRVA
jgi:hypothetical protein